MVKVDWIDKDGMKSSFPLLGVDGNILDVGDNYKYLRAGDILFVPRICDQFRVIKTPISGKVTVILSWGTPFYVSMRTVAYYFGVAISTIKRWCRMGVIPADKTKSGWRVYRTLVMDETPELLVGDSLIMLCSARAD